jgi:endoglucanase
MFKRTALALLVTATALASCRREPVDFIRVNQLGYTPDATKVAVVCSLEETAIEEFTVRDDDGDVVYGPAPAEPAGPFAPCSAVHRLDFTALSSPGVYRVFVSGAESLPFPIRADAYAGSADTLLVYMRQQRSGFNPVFNDSVHHETDAIIVDHPTREGEFVPVAGGWADAADYLQYVTTSAHATFSMLIAYRDHPTAFGDAHQADGLPGANGVPDILDEARHGLEWLSRMFPGDGTVFNQLGDDRDHAFADLPVNDSSDYGWGRGGPRPVYPCTGKPQGLLEHKNRSTGIASTAGKFASAFALGAQVLRDRDPSFAEALAAKAVAAYEIGRANPGVCQTAPAGAPYFYEEDSWADDMELAAIELYALTDAQRYLDEAIAYASREPVTPWMGADTANHYQWFPWHNYGHYEIWRHGSTDVREVMVDYYRRGLEAVAGRADNGFRVGVPFIWCSNNLMASFATQALLYRKMSGDDAYRNLETSAVDWLFGANPWGVSMVIGLPAHGVFPLDPHSVVSRELGLQLTGGLVDGPVYRSIFENLRGITLYNEDEYAPFNTGRAVYHDDYGDYSTNEPIMDGTANLAYVLAAAATY